MTEFWFAMALLFKIFYELAGAGYISGLEYTRKGLGLKRLAQLVLRLQGAEGQDLYCLLQSL